MRELKYHEKKLLKKVDFITWDDNQTRENMLMKKYHIDKREDIYNKLSMKIVKIARKIKRLDKKDPFRTTSSLKLLTKLYDIGLVKDKSSLQRCNGVNSEAFCKRRLPVLIKKYKYAENLKNCVDFIEQGHIRVGCEIVMEPAYLVTRTNEDFITWTDQSAIKKKIAAYNQDVDDFDLNC